MTQDAHKITSIKAQIKNPERVSVYVNGKYAFSLNHAQLLEQQLHIGLEVDEAKLQELKKVSQFGKAYERTLNYVMIRPRSRREVEDYCRRKKWPAEDCKQIIEKLAARNYINDLTFARAWAQNRALTKKTSTRKLKLELKQKGVSEEVIAQALTETDFDETAALKQLIAKKRKLSRYAHDDQKLMQYLVRQGFSYDDVKNELDQ